MSKERSPRAVCSTTIGTSGKGASFSRCSLPVDVQPLGCVFNLPHTVERSLILRAAPDEVWAAITDAELLSEWLAPGVELEPEEGGAPRCRYEEGEERQGEVELVEEAERLAFRWWRDGEPPSRVELIVDAVAA